jgi:acetyl esterase/lipase
LTGARCTLHAAPEENEMTTTALDRRGFLIAMGALGVAGFPNGATAAPARLRAGRGSRGGAVYDPRATFEIDATEVEFRRTSAGRQLMARVYKPKGAGPFPTMLDLHGGAWNAKDRYAEEPMDRAIARSGVLVVAIDMTLAGEAPYPANVQDAHYGVRWLKWKASSWNGDASKVGVYASSSGGHVAQLIAMRPRDARYGAIPLAEAPSLDATVAFVAMRSPISDPFARFQNAERLKRESMIKNHLTYFKPWETIFEGNPQLILERREPVTLVPMLVMQGALDDNVLPSVQEKFAAAYRAAGGDCRLEIFEGSEHEWVGKPGPQTDRAREMVKAFIARNLQT